MSILATTDFSAPSARALRTAARLARTRDVPLLVLHCVEAAADAPTWYPEHPSELPNPEKYGRNAMEELDAFVEDVIPEDERPDVLETEIELEHAAEGIGHHLDEGGFEFVVMGATGRNRIASALLGSTPEEIIRRSEIPVLVVAEEGELGPWRRILVPLDLSESSRTVLDHASQLAREEQAELDIMHAFPPTGVDGSSLPAATPREARESLQDIHAKRFHRIVRDANLDDLDWATHEVSNRPNDAIVEAVEEFEADIVVMGTHGRRGFQKWLLGSTATKVLRQMPCSILTVPVSEPVDEE